MLFGNTKRFFSEQSLEMADMYMQMGKIYLALREYENSEEENIGSYANTSKNIGLIYQHIGDSGKAIKYMKKAKSIFDEIAPSLQNARCMEMINKILTT